MSFDPNAAAAADSGIFGLPFAPDEARVVLLPVPWDATTSYGSGVKAAVSGISARGAGARATIPNESKTLRTSRSRSTAM